LWAAWIVSDWQIACCSLKGFLSPRQISIYWQDMFLAYIDSLFAFCSANELFLNVQKCKTVRYRWNCWGLVSYFWYDSKFETHIQEITKKSTKCWDYLWGRAKTLKTSSHMFVLKLFGVPEISRSNWRYSKKEYTNAT
jgi:hypothetical protein